MAKMGQVKMVSLAAPHAESQNPSRSDDRIVGRWTNEELGIGRWTNEEQRIGTWTNEDLGIRTLTNENAVLHVSTDDWYSINLSLANAIQE